MFKSEPVSSLILHFSKGLTVFGTVLLAGCANTGPVTPATADTPVPEKWQQTAPQIGTTDAATLAKWWLTFNDPALNELIDGALQTSPDVRTALAKIEESRASYRVERSSLLPSVTGSVTDKNVHTRDRSTQVTTRTETASASLDASWEIDLFGRQRLATKAAAADLAQSEENFHDAQVSLIAEVASTYVTLREAETTLAVVSRSLQTLEDTYQLSKWKEQAGSGSALDVQSALTNLEQTRASLPTYRQTVTEARNKLALLSGKQPGALDTLLGKASPVPSTSATLAVGIPADTLRQRPDVRAAGHALEAAIARTSVAQRKRFPTLSLTGSIGVDALRANKLFSPESTFNSLLGSLTAPILDAGTISQTIKIQEAQQKQVLIAYQSSILTALSEVENALSSVQRNSERLASLQKAEAAAGESAKLAQQRYEAGDLDFYTVLDTQRTQLSVQESRIATTASLTTAYIQLYKALGGGWTNL